MSSEHLHPTLALPCHGAPSPGANEVWWLAVCVLYVPHVSCDMIRGVCHMHIMIAARGACCWERHATCALLLGARVPRRKLDECCPLPHTVLL